jgi:hypothetical protein
LILLSFLRFVLRPSLTPLSIGVMWQGRNAQTLLPLTVKQIMDAAQSSDDKSNFAVDGVEVFTVRIFSLSRWCLVDTTNVSFSKDSSFGLLEDATNFTVSLRVLVSQLTRLVRSSSLLISISSWIFFFTCSNSILSVEKYPHGNLYGQVITKCCLGPICFIISEMPFFLSVFFYYL